MKQPMASPKRNPSEQQGFSMVMAIFILVVLSLLSTYMTRFIGIQRTTEVDALQVARALQVAKAGLSWAVAQIDAGGNCTNIQNVVLTLPAPSLNGFNVTLTCSSQSYTEGLSSETIYVINEIGRAHV